jgi:uncharacterized membrane protein YgcG
MGSGGQVNDLASRLALLSSSVRSPTLRMTVNVGLPLLRCWCLVAALTRVRCLSLVPAAACCSHRVLHQDQWCKRTIRIHRKETDACQLTTVHAQIMSRDDAMAQMDEYREELEDYDVKPEELAKMASGAQAQGGAGAGGSFDGAGGAGGAAADEL